MVLIGPRSSTRPVAGRDGRVAHSTQSMWNLSRFLLGQAMQRAESEHEIHGMDANHRTVFKQFAQDAESDAIVWIIESGNDYRRVADIKIRVARGQTIAVEMEG